MDDCYFFNYLVIFYDEYTDETITVTGITYAENYTRATEKITSYYDDSSIISLKLEGLEDYTVYEISSTQKSEEEED